ncbi:MAG TPA: molybdopterin-dependent oxidoreductase [Gemmatimonadaceae bacterium]|jgi:Fe-S-cluster-containing dehydrogenase component/formylmethanofuran dehydrogenase subunit B|nr:molybdopterin-dependent oxidoreductase [Gemmatimonadaceae bacterium]
MSQDTKTPGVKRREFLKVLGATSAAVAAAGCSEETGKLIPYLVSPDQTVPGVSTYYATTCRECSAACGVIAETRDGRAIKLEGNPDHPVNRGALCARGQAALQGLYNPDRFRSPMVNDGGTWKPISWDDAIVRLSQGIAQARTGNRAAGAVFINQHESGSFPRFLDAWLAGFGMPQHLSVDFEADAAAIEANRRTYGAAWPALSFKDAKLIVSFGADFLEGWGASVPQQLDFADARAQLDGAPRFVYIGPRRSLTGLNADEWIACKPGSELSIANALAGKGSIQQAATDSGVDQAALQSLANELAAAKPALVLSGVSDENALDVALAVAAINQASAAVGVTIKPAQPHTAFEGMAHTDQLLGAVERMRAGQVGVAFVRGVNPAYHLPKAANFAEAFLKVPFRVSFSSFPDETTELCTLIIPDLHSLESWGDAEPVRGTIALQQPVMDPVFRTNSKTIPVALGTADVLMQVAKKDATVASKYTAADYRTMFVAAFPGGAAGLAAALPKGLSAGTLPARTIAAAPPVAPKATGMATAPGDFFLIAYASPLLGDGRGANKPWLVELPDPVTKVCWTSWVEIHPETAQRLGIERGDILEVKTANGTVRAPAFPYLGVHKDAIAIPSGLGHRAARPIATFNPLTHTVGEVQWGYGRYARDIGVNVFDLLPVATHAAGGFVWTSTKATVRKTGDHEVLPSTEGSARQHGRGIAQAINAGDLNKPAGGEGGTEAKEALPGDASHAFLPGLRSPVAADAQGELGSPTSADQGTKKGLYRDDDIRGMTKRRWAMTVDLARCTGCSACITACNAENNVPTVGAFWQNATIFADQKPGLNIARGREMSWIRLERYFEGNPDGRFGQDFETRFVPMLCQHCGNAPCEPVCPVYATYHAPDGLNVQVYNRCVGTRYCSNNCPYKVRYFNWFGYGESDRKQYAFPEPLNWQLNPDVTVRGKGVMEKCSFCVQRIREAENRATLEQRELQPDEFTVACAQGCPSRAITFGDAADPNWTVAQLAHDKRAYHVFEELNTYTAVVYLKKVNHPAAGATAPRA